MRLDPATPASSSVQHSIIFCREILLEPPAAPPPVVPPPYQSQDRIPNHSFITPKIFPTSPNEYPHHHRQHPVFEHPAAGRRQHQQRQLVAGAARLGLNSSGPAAPPPPPIVDIYSTSTATAAPNKYPSYPANYPALNPDVSLQRVTTNYNSPAASTSSTTSSGTSSPPSVISRTSHVEHERYVHLQVSAYPIVVTDLVYLIKLDFRLRGISQKIDSRQVEQGFSSFFAKFLPFFFTCMMIFQNVASQWCCRTFKTQ